jgi:hypothetical protein
MNNGRRSEPFDRRLFDIAMALRSIRYAPPRARDPRIRDAWYDQAAAQIEAHLRRSGWRIERAPQTADPMAPRPYPSSRHDDG